MLGMSIFTRKKPKSSKEINYDNGDKYIGETIEQVREGKGVYYYADGNKYEGMYKKNKKDGIGVFTYKNGVIYDGNFKRGNFHGFGHFYYEDDLVFHGNFSQGYFDDSGELSLQNDFKYTFVFKHRKVSKIGVTFEDSDMKISKDYFYITFGNDLYINDALYHGILENCLIFDCSGNKYKGSIEDGLFHGDGHVIYDNGDEFFGKFQKGFRKGSGRYFTLDSGYYEGDFDKSGIVYKGKYINTKIGARYYRYEGEFNGFKFQGKGRIYYSNGSSYVGDFINNQSDGFGTMYYPNDYEYEGSFSEGLFYGKGTLYKNNVEVSIFELKEREGIIVHELYEDEYGLKHGILFYNSGSYYEGDFENKVPNGFGKYYVVTSAYYEGNFLNGLFNGKGLLVTESNNTLRGEFKDDIIFEGEHVSSSGYIRLGKFSEWSNLNGEGKIILLNKTIIEGTFSDDLLNGRGRITYFDGSVLEGDFQDGKFLGKGSITLFNKEYGFEINSDKCEGIAILDDEVIPFIEDRLSEENSIDTSKEIKGRLYCFDGIVCYSSFKNLKMNGEAVVFYSNGNRYEGELKDNFRHGYGKFYFANGDEYEGEFSEGYHHGKGIMIYNNGVKYDGEFEGGSFHGSGVYYLSNGDRYECEFQNGSPNGYGSFYQKSGNYYEGNFKDWDYSGMGNRFFLCGGSYSGEFEKGYFNGKGELLFNDGSSYVGEFSEGFFSENGVFTLKGKEKYDIIACDRRLYGIGFSHEDEELFYIFDNDREGFSGRGKIYFSASSVYDGEILEGKMNGLGELVYSDNYKMVGSFSMGSLKDGKMYNSKGVLAFDGEFNKDSSYKKGTLYFENGNTYTGEFLNEMFHGFGIFKFESGTKIEGEFDRGYIFKGRIEYDNGAIYEGELENFRAHGTGKKLFVNETFYEGTFLNDSMDGYGTIFFSNGNKYVGEFKDDYIEGNGTYFFKDNSKWEGLFKTNTGGKFTFVEGVKYDKDGKIEEELSDDLLWGHKYQ